ncbi:hypothetical protein BDN70DRAFT_990269 [Pholiota conissans]|uniref:Uncharacterized protein n=1 Tax=Pholiota conissans TaxID=109636 RepID=A0A9P5Z8G6_9AGAR|nr:hypothetical protein BDN70DRAFT_990269 [Pholiota conissans]
MFTLPQGDEGVPANSDENPIVLHDDVDDFRALCWIIYCSKLLLSPTVHLKQRSLRTADLQYLVGLYLISQKYHFEAHESFAHQLLRDHCFKLSSPIPLAHWMETNYLYTCPQSRLKSLLRISTFTTVTDQPPKKSGSLANLLQKVWTSRLKKQNESIRFALEVATDLGLRNFMADLYYVQLTRMKPTYSSVTSLAYAHPVNDLIPEQNLNLYKGFWSLYYYWVGTYNAYQVNDICDCGHECQAAWKECWNEIYTKPSTTFDPLDLVQQLEGILGTHAPKGEIELHLKCAHGELTDLRSTLITSLPDHFLGPIPASVSDT